MAMTNVVGFIEGMQLYTCVSRADYQILCSLSRGKATKGPFGVRKEMRKQKGHLQNTGDLELS
jgi:hypothetical protein